MSEPTDTTRAANEGAANEVINWKALALDALRAMQQARVWNGMGWTYNPLHPMFYTPIMNRIDAAERAQRNTCRKCQDELIDCKKCTQCGWSVT